MVGSPQDIDCVVNTTVSGVSSVSVSWTGPGGVPILSNTNRVTISPPLLVVIFLLAVSSLPT